jgi:hypothetical protein
MNEYLFISNKFLKNAVIHQLKIDFNIDGGTSGCADVCDYTTNTDW